MASVTYIPSQTVDESASTSNRASVLGPWSLFFYDALILLRNLDYVFHVLLPVRIPAHRPGVRYHLAPIIANETLLALSIVYEVVLLIVGSPAIFILPGWASVIFFLVTTGIVVLLAAPGWGSRTVQSRNSRVTFNKFPHEKWIFMNGVAQSHLDLQFTVDNLSATFGRPFLGIHNRSLGFVWDIRECLIQRCCGYSSEDVRICYDELKIPLLDPSITKVIVIAHSQGGIILSLTVDRMFAELPATSMSKLEVYTFGSAAAHFNNPLRFCSLTDHKIRTRGALKEHHNRRRRPYRKEEHLPAVKGPIQAESVPEDGVTMRGKSRILDRPIAESPNTSPVSNFAVAATLGEIASEVQQKSSILSRPTIGEPLKRVSSDPILTKAGPVILPTETTQPPKSPLPESDENFENMMVPERASQGDLSAQVRDAPSISAPLRTSSPTRPIASPAEAIVDTATAGSQSFLWKSSIGTSGKVIEQSEPAEARQPKEPSTQDIRNGWINPRDGAYDGTQSGPITRHKNVANYVNESSDHIIPVIEHYCNEFDMVPRWGVLTNVQFQPQHRYAGSVFIHRQTSGHLFNRHYLDTMFPMDQKAQHFLDQVVDVDIRTAKARAGALASSVAMAPDTESEARSWMLYDSITELLSPSNIFARILAVVLYIHLRLAALSRMSTPSFGQTTKVLKEGVGLLAADEKDINVGNMRDGDRIERVKALVGTVEKLDTDIAIEQGNGKTVRQLSKLWRYMYGGTA